MSSFSYFLSATVFLASGINQYYGLPFSREINAIGFAFMAEKVIGWVNNYFYRKLTERHMIRSRELMVFGSNLAIFYLMAGVQHKSAFITQFYEKRNLGISSLNILAFLWRITSNMAYYRRIFGLTVSSIGLMGFGILDSLIQRNRQLVVSFINNIETQLRNGSTIGFYYRGTELFLYPPNIRQEIMPITHDEIDKIAPLRCAGLNNVKKEEEIINEFEKPESCIICLEEFNAKELHRTLPCFHTFHAGCIDSWLLKSAGLCPICKSKLK